MSLSRKKRITRKPSVRRTRIPTSTRRAQVKRAAISHRTEQQRITKLIKTYAPIERAILRAHRRTVAAETHIARLMKLKRVSTKKLIINEKRAQVERSRYDKIVAYRDKAYRKKQWMKVSDFEKVMLASQGGRGRLHRYFRRKASNVAPGNHWIHLPTKIVQKTRSAIEGRRKVPQLLAHFTVYKQETKRVYDKRGRLTKQRKILKDTYISQTKIVIVPGPDGLVDMKRFYESGVMEKLQQHVTAKFSRMPKKGAASDTVIIVLGMDYLTLFEGGSGFPHPAEKKQLPTKPEVPQTPLIPTEGDEHDDGENADE